MKLAEAPVLLIIFNRPDTTKLVFEAIRKAKPSKLFVSADAPRNGNKNDEVNCLKAREIVKYIDWECNLKYRFIEENLGCGWGPASAITWAFENEDRLIILEDDCVPSQAFFLYANYVLERYLNDTRVWFVSGRNDVTKPELFMGNDYTFSHYGHSWGWATWKRCWNHFDMNMSNLDNFIKNGGAKNVFYSKREGTIWNEKYKRLKQDTMLHTHVWDFQFGYAITSNGGLSIVPAKNLIENVGFFGTHSKGVNKSCELKSHEDFTIKNEPEFVIANRDFDRFHFEKKILYAYRKKPMYLRIIHKIFKILRLKK